MADFENAIGYIISKYTHREEESMAENCDAVLELWDAGIECYSPIASTHPVEVRRKDRNNIECANAVMKGVSVNLTKTLFAPDYIAHDLFLIKRLMKHDTGKCHVASILYEYTGTGCPIDDCTHCEHAPPKYDSGVFGIVLESAVPTVRYIQNSIPDAWFTKPVPDKTLIPAATKSEPWFSNGVTDEYMFCKSNRILMITKADAIIIPRKHWREFAL